MREHHLHTPQKEHQLANRRTKWSSEQPKKPKKITGKCLNSVFSRVSEDVTLESLKDSIDISSIFEVSDDNQLYESAENIVTSSSPVVSPSVASTVADLSLLSTTIIPDVFQFSSMINSDLSPLSSTVTSDKAQSGDVSVNFGTPESSIAVKGGSIKAELVAKKFRQAGIQTATSNDMVLLSKNILDALFKIIIEEFHNLPERDWFTEIVEKKVFLVLRKVFCVILTFMLLIIVLKGAFFFSSGGRDSFNEPLPT